MTSIVGCYNNQSKKQNEFSQKDEMMLPFTKSEQIKLTEIQFTPRHDFERSKIIVNSAFPSGYATKKSLFVHPTSTSEYTLVDFEIDLTGYKSGSLIVLEYSVGIADGANADGVEFASFINDKKIMSVVTKENRWISQISDISIYSGQKIILSLGTKGSPTVNSAWAAFGDPLINIIENNTHFMGVRDKNEIKTTVSGDLIKKEKSYSGKGTIKFEADEFTNGDAYLIVSGKGKPAVNISVGNKKHVVKQILSDSKSEYRGIISVGNTAKISSDWDVALGLPKSVITPMPFDKVLPYKRNLTIEHKGDNEYTVDSIEVWRKPGNVKVTSFKTGGYNENIHTDTVIKTKFYNNGCGAILQTDGYELFVEVVDSKGNKKTLESKPIPDMAPGSEYTYSYPAGKIKAGECLFKLMLKDGRGIVKIGEYKTNIKNVDNSINSEKSGNISIQDSNIKLVIIKEGAYYKDASLFDKKTNIKIGTFAIPRFVTEEMAFETGNFRVKEHSDSIAVLSQTTNSGEIQVNYQIVDGRLKITHTLIAIRELGLKAFDGPHFLCGEGSFGGEHDSAVFAGIEYLSTEASNNSLAGVKPESNRFAPNPKKITTPLMTIAKNGMLINFSWPSEKEWTSGSIMPMARFESPAIDASDYSIMGIFAPSGTQYIKENTLFAHNPMPMKNGDKITLEAFIKVTNGINAVDGMVDYLKDKSLPEIPTLNKTELDVFKALVKGHKEELVNENGWLGFLGIDTLPSVNNESVHSLIAAQHLLSPTQSNDAKEILTKIKIPSVKFDWGYSDSIYFRMQKDYMDSYYSIAENLIYSTLANQAKDGTWSFNANTPKSRLFGRSGDITMGTVAVPVINLIKTAKLTGNKDAWNGALLGIDGLSKFTKPAGAGPWELPNTNPDILAAALGLKACMNAYEYSGEEKFIKVANQIAKQTLPFIYFNEIPRKPVSLYTTIPSFGATNWTRMWQGSSVQWEGMILAEELKRIGRTDKTLDWGKIGRGITNSGINLVNNNRQPGRFPDFLDMFKSDSTIYNIWGNLVARAVYSDMGFKPEWSEKTTSGIKAVSGYEITDFKVDNKNLSLKLKIPNKMPCYLLIHTNNISSARVGGANLKYLEGELDKEKDAYRKMSGKDVYVFKITGNTDETNLNIVLK